MPLSYHVDSATRINNRGLGKPNEDIVFVDRDHHIFILLDGITRVHAEYRIYPGRSAALEVGEIFLEAAYAYLTAHMEEPDADGLLHQAALAGNAAIVPYRNQRTLEQWQYYPGVLGILAILRGEQLHYAYLGDSLAAHIHGSEKEIFGRQTQLQTIAQMRVSKQDMYEKYCNHPESPLGYGIFNGDETVTSLLDHGVRHLSSGDTVILCSDGLGPYLCETDIQALRTLSPEEMLDASAPFDVPPYAPYADDKAIIKITFE